MKSLLTVILALCMSPAVWAETTISAREVQKAVEQFVLTQVESELPEDARPVVDVRWQGDLAFAVDGAPQIRVRRTSSRPLRGPSVVRVGIDVGGQTQRSMSVTADVRIWRPVVVASHMIKRGEEMAMVGCELAERDVTKVRGAYYSDIQVLEGMQARRTLSMGDIITDGHIEKIPIVRRGDAIRLVARAGRMNMSAAGEAMQNGGVGDRIRVKNSDSGKIVYGHILEDGAIQVGL
ncbi:MAG: flagellar basal body P-ring formation chaperone FlgA [Candidatus Latescibacterota bacterium]|nr:flagellar basal body P-ring formation chaperone FlgA [Candidatus Latescibacterota bacterium]MEC8647028.1 flagellar basal body P-ring formation chaperone FlgA [Candidatus Latescibacterota bacterium]MEE2628332.1 flagellar basal body P-ring formation chaperone FlgA [Candidatus Latescibacterota bacterium]MEE2728550.1 flagellar basal body P-ring formation chaperone FlgA [Candidatus Latescibacterota bacterium]